MSRGGRGTGHALGYLFLEHETMKTSELTEAALDWAVCRAQHPDADMSATHVWLDTGDGEDDFLIDKTSTDWAQGGPIIEREKIGINPASLPCSDWVADTQIIRERTHQHGSTPLIAAMRCYVASKLGDEVEVPF